MVPQAKLWIHDRWEQFFWNKVEGGFKGDFLPKCIEILYIVIPAVFQAETWEFSKNASKSWKNVSKCFEMLFFGKRTPKLTYVDLGMHTIVVKVKIRRGGNNFQFFTHSYCGFFSSWWDDEKSKILVLRDFKNDILDRRWLRIQFKMILNVYEKFFSSFFGPKLL